VFAIDENAWSQSLLAVPKSVHETSGKDPRAIVPERYLVVECTRGGVASRSAEVRHFTYRVGGLVDAYAQADRNNVAAAHRGEATFASNCTSSKFT
jgi:hypothetical protein